MWPTRLSRRLGYYFIHINGPNDSDRDSDSESESHSDDYSDMIVMYCDDDDD